LTRKSAIDELGLPSAMIATFTLLAPGEVSASYARQ